MNNAPISGLVPYPGRRTWQGLLAAAFLAELLLFTWLRGCAGPYWSPALFGGAGLLLGGAALGALRGQAFTLAPGGAVSQRVGWGGLAWLAGAALVLARQLPVVLGSPIDVHSSDVIPIVQTYVARFRSGEVVYRYLTNLPYPLFPNHLPMQWLPYVPLQPLGVDFRWLAWTLLLGVGIGAYQLVALRQPGSGLRFGLKALLPAVVLWQVGNSDPALYSQVLEPTIIAYYFLLAASLLIGPAWARGGALVLCLLSRYSVIFWVPLFLWMLWREAGWRHALLVAAIILAGALGIYIIPFFAHDPTIFTHALAEYRIATLGEWTRSGGPAAGLPYHLGNGLSAAPWLYSLPLSLEAKVTWAQRLHALASAGAALVLAGFYWRYGRHYDYRYLALVSLKLYLVVFYFFIQIPYAYLISLSVLLSVFVVLVGLAPPPPRTAEASPASNT